VAPERVPCDGDQAWLTVERRPQMGERARDVSDLGAPLAERPLARADPRKLNPSVVKPAARNAASTVRITGVSIEPP
jgi:hypothetical protein